MSVCAWMINLQMSNVDHKKSFPLYIKHLKKQATKRCASPNQIFTKTFVSGDDLPKFKIIGYKKKMTVIILV